MLLSVLYMAGCAPEGTCPALTFPLRSLLVQIDFLLLAYFAIIIPFGSYSVLFSNITATMVFVLMPEWDRCCSSNIILENAGSKFHSLVVKIILACH